MNVRMGAHIAQAPALVERSEAALARKTGQIAGLAAIGIDVEAALAREEKLIAELAALGIDIENTPWNELGDKCPDLLERVDKHTYRLRNDEVPA